MRSDGVGADHWQNGKSAPAADPSPVWAVVCPTMLHIVGLCVYKGAVVDTSN
jgi:hypothetical protein